MKAVELLTDYNVNSKHFEKVPINGEIDINIPDLKGATPLIRAVANEHVDVVRHLLKLNVLINEQDKDGNTALRYACYLNNEDLTTYLVLAGASIDIRNNFGYPPLAYASKAHQSNLQSLYAETCNAIKSMGKQIY
jgi:ankyrin repeat protein